MDNTWPWLIFTVLIFVVSLIYIALKRPASSFPSSRKASVLVVVGSGGHTREILTLMSGLGEHYTPRYYVMATTDTMSEGKIQDFESKKGKDNSENFKIYKIPRSREVKQSWITTVLSTLQAMLVCFPLVFRLRPNIILCNGPGTCIPLCTAGFLLKILTLGKTQIIYVESVCRVETLSMSARLLYYVADDIFVQWDRLQKRYPRSKYIGRLV
ncbi:UDP-N-acetylglucosamine transferase subunit ALG14 homolog isoform X2 [Mizuhopecten yessoensis]|uniref:UDP-N-acetylglucosamine transferase subunit ALG14 n=1 Tax=Mizuhopecten yessoensis TaxID=6573 RepID=A0A210PRM2_MIZYE|nr:UDP-N-acetylglucosamine transferase subunit ALG14 homolog isoform X1 [Mizuhopecten yessoensis]XP_021376961.1 UDP-N-acetylglucosamine transferase subunit ALG14 homolog isoform X1 [Mizuhopecten yessoensis]XP_021376962.1 UDP-N-acetylglucosamine transferase subunit ALG14 homolog isoform X2 [Mizuhopecten yessoensis]OWF39128.1 UDP-N-acetylglucosamine transferase subunit ALG14-like [Mizuhopecten yessoensis]